MTVPAAVCKIQNWPPSLRQFLTSVNLITDAEAIIVKQLTLTHTRTTAPRVKHKLSFIFTNVGWKEDILIFYSEPRIMQILTCCDRFFNTSEVDTFIDPTATISMVWPIKQNVHECRTSVFALWHKSMSHYIMLWSAITMKSAEGCYKFSDAVTLNATTLNDATILNESNARKRCYLFKTEHTLFSD